MKSIFVALSIFLIMGLVLVPGGNALENNSSGLKLVKEFEGGRLYKADKLLVLQLQGSYREMGRQEGELLKDNLTELYEEAIANNNTRIALLKNITYQNLKLETQNDFKMYPRRFQEILYGMNDTSKIGLDKLIELNQMIRLGELDSFVLPEGHCSSIAAWGKYTNDGPLVFGRNFDWRDYYRKYAKFVAVTVYNPNDGSNPTASVGYIGSLEILSGMNSQGIFVELNDGSISKGKGRISNRMTFIDLTGFLFDTNTLKQLDTAISSTNTFWPSIVNVADGNVSYSYEWALDAVKQRAPDHDGLLVATNHFVDPSWEIPLPADPTGIPSKSQTVERRINLLNLGDEYKGHINVTTMETILDTAYENGGATRSNTVIQIIAVPGDRTLWVQLPDNDNLGTKKSQSYYQNWVKVDLKSLFQNSSSNNATSKQVDFRRMIDSSDNATKTQNDSQEVMTPTNSK